MSILVNAATKAITQGITGVLLATAAATSAADLPSADLGSPAGLFTSVCLADDVRLPADRFRTASFDKLPDGVKAVMGFGLPPKSKADAAAMLTPISEADVPNKLLLLLPAKDTYLLLPAPAGNGRLAEQCAVIWRGNHYADALTAANNALEGQDIKALLPRGKSLPGMNSVSIQSGGRIVGAAEFGGWTMVRIAPDTSPAEQATQ